MSKNDKKAYDEALDLWKRFEWLDGKPSDTVFAMGVIEGIRQYRIKKGEIQPWDSTGCFYFPRK